MSMEVKGDEMQFKDYESDLAANPLESRLPKVYENKVTIYPVVGVTTNNGR